MRARERSHLVEVERAVRLEHARVLDEALGEPVERPEERVLRRGGREELARVADLRGADAERRGGEASRRARTRRSQSSSERISDDDFPVFTSFCFRILQ